MADSLTITNAPLAHAGMDYARLRREGIKIIEQLAGSQWTDYNAHDPGITILEALCYAITDLSYRLSFDMADLLAYPAEAPGSPLFLTARDSLTVNPLTIADYRKLLIDIDGIKNAWLEPIETPQPELYYDANNAKLTFSSLDLAEPVHLRGLYHVLLEQEPGYQAADLVSAAKARLHQHRNLCEDFAEIRVLPIEEITVRAEIEIADAADPHQLMAQLHRALDKLISPVLPFVSLPELLERGVPVEEIFAGPRLQHGFIDDDQLEEFQRQSELHTSDLIHVILNLPGIETVRQITIASDRSPTPQAWALDLDQQLTPRLKPVRAAIAAGDIRFYKGQIPCSPTVERVEAKAAVLENTTVPHSPQLDLPVPAGDYRQLAEYESIQTEFPLAYGIGELGLPASASDQRQAEAKQLQAYLMVFDQLLANCLTQLDQVKALFSPENRDVKTYFAQSLAHFPGGAAILAEGYSDRLERLPESEAIACDRKNRLLDHLMAQYGETFTEASLLYPDADVSDLSRQHSVIQPKVDFVSQYRAVSADRNRAFNYTLNPNQLENFQNVSGLKRRLARLLGIEPSRRFLASSNSEGFYLIEHILLRPRAAGATGAASGEAASPDFLSFAHAISGFSPSERPDQVTCTSPQHGLQAGEQITIFYSSYYSGTYEVINPQADTFDILHEFVAADTGEWVSSQQFPDPFSFQVSVILPDWPQRFRSANVKQLIRNTLIAETPAHIHLRLHWLTSTKMREFETLYALWLQDLSGNVTDSTEAATAATRLINFLELGSSEIPDFPALVGYMTIGETFVVA
ncbi:hypothetical protein [Sphaerothrix gracilis]|uniref:hypothetical protein n=1 Tax=Sphaerothrix gracilis TaxID=3151835 RepID=UPI0031FCF741